MFTDTFKKTCQHNAIDLHAFNPDQACSKGETFLLNNHTDTDVCKIVQTGEPYAGKSDRHRWAIRCCHPQNHRCR
jgi:hypothetical protein